MTVDSPELALDEATGRLVRTVDGLSDEEWAAPCRLPGWSRAHLVAHLTLNAEGLAAALDGVARGEPVSMYASQAARDRDIDELAAAEPGELRERMLASTTRFEQAARDVPEERWATPIERVPGGPTFRASAVPAMRLREVEIHHVDLDAGYAPSAWPAAFSALVVDAMAKRLRQGEPFRVLATDTGGTWTVGTGEPGTVVSGAAADLAWWLTGRGSGEGVASSSGRLPEVGSW